MDGPQEDLKRNSDGDDGQNDRSTAYRPLKPIERLAAFSLAAFHISLALWSLTMMLAGFVFWPDLGHVSGLVIFALAAASGISVLMNGAAGWRQVLVLLRRRAIRPPDLVALGFALLTVYIAGRIFI